MEVLSAIVFIAYRPVLARNICCTISWTMFPLRFHAALLKCNLSNYLQLRPPLFP